MNNEIYHSLEMNSYSIGVYTDNIFLDSDINKYENVERGSYKIANISKFIEKLYKMIAFNYSPHQLKKIFFIDTDEFSRLKRVSGDYNAYSFDVQEFGNQITSAGITVSEPTNCFRLYHLDGAHAPYTFGKDLVSDKNTIYGAYDEAAGNCIMLEDFFVELKNKEIYDNTTIVIMADHGQIGYCQNPLFMIKNKYETHDFKISNVAMSYEYLSDIWVALANGEDVNDDFIRNCRSSQDYRRFLFYSWDNSWNREYLPGILEMLTYGVANNAEEMMYSGVQYEANAENYSYSLGTQLSFTTEDTANRYCIFGFTPSEEWGTWTNGKSSTMEFNIKGEKYNNLLLTIESGTYHSQQEVIIDVNNQKVADIKFNGLETKSIIIPKEYVINDTVRITMQFPNAVAPSSVDADSSDERLLALGMRSIKLDSTDEVFDLNNQVMIGKYNLGTVISFTNTNNNANQYCVTGFSQAEDTYTWTNSNTAEMEFVIIQKANDMNLKYTAFPFNGKQHVVLYANNEKIADYYLLSEETKEILIPGQYNEGDKLNLRFELPDAISPKELGMSDDIRTLGLAMKDLTIEK